MVKDDTVKLSMKAKHIVSRCHTQIFSISAVSIAENSKIFIKESESRGRQDI